MRVLALILLLPILVSAAGLDEKTIQSKLPTMILKKSSFHASDVLGLKRGDYVEVLVHRALKFEGKKDGRTYFVTFRKGDDLALYLVAVDKNSKAAIANTACGRATSAKDVIFNGKEEALDYMCESHGGMWTYEHLHAGLKEALQATGWVKIRWLPAKTKTKQEFVVELGEVR